ncbi:DinB family protein [Salinarimonas rosea]|uniref:DinB family protein n=1 Tax=Salinarimonas rosea TaxID=552063 RepID=UPI000401915A|nr:DinB family protein [Salinarimonas rosea]
MITPDYPRIMARYNRWQNASLIAAASTLSDAERWRDRGAFLGSIARTLNHVYWDDRIWSARLARDGRDKSIPYAHPYADEPRDWAEYVRLRRELDDALIAWADDLTTAAMGREAPWMKNGALRRPRLGFCVVHLFNHQTHHRGQAHAMLTMAGARPDETDLHVAPEIGPDVLGLPTAPGGGD